MMTGAIRPMNLLVGLFVGVLAVSGAAWVKPKCEWNEYYDENMNDCGPCREICDHMVTTGTDDQCKTECREYLMSRKCTYLQFYDHGTENCEPCSDICDHQERQGTQKECSDKCVYYLRSLNCTKVEEYFNETRKKCASCADLCHGEGVSQNPCQQKCHAFVEKTFEGRLEAGKDDLSLDGGTTRNTPLESSHPGVITTIAIAAAVTAACLATLIGLVYHARTKKGKEGYARGADSDNAAADDSDDVMRGVRPRNGRIFQGTTNQTWPALGLCQGPVVAVAETSLSKTSIQETPGSQTTAVLAVSGDPNHVLAASSGGAALLCESAPLLRVDSLNVSLHSGSFQDVWRVEVEVEEGGRNHYAIPECDPLAPSSAGFAQTRRDPPCSVEECRV